ncbi:MAG: transposase [Spirochaetes bacterium]|nr:MAG: transposase [Spirochaetota bacterium]
MPYRHFTSDERDALQVFIDKELTIDCIARILKKHISSLYREIARNSQEGIYLSRYAETVSKNRRAHAKPCPKRRPRQIDSRRAEGQSKAEARNKHSFLSHFEPVGKNRKKTQSPNKMGILLSP